MHFWRFDAHRAHDSIRGEKALRARDDVAGRTSRVQVVLAAWAALCVSCVSLGGPFDVVDQLDAKLVRGQSTTEDVRRLLGKPDGKGSGRFPPGWANQEIWLYQEQEVHSDFWNPDIRDGKLEADAEVRDLLVLFVDGRFDGYLWSGLRVEGEDLP
jgi:hypothetical protein